MTIVERCGDMFRVWSTCSDSYYDEPKTRDDLTSELLAWGWTPENVTKRLDTAEVVEAWALSSVEQDALLLGCKPDDVRYWGEP